MSFTFTSSGAPYLIFSLIENENKTGSWLTIPIFFRSHSKLIDFISTPSIDIVPEIKKIQII